MNKIRILKDQNIAIITAYDDINPMNRLKSISSDLSQLDFSGIVLFDLFFFNGLSFNRFAFIDFDGNKFIKKSIKVQSHIEPSLEASQNNFLLEHREIIDQSVLSSKEIHNLYA